MSSECEWPTMTLRSAGVTLIDCVHKTPEAALDGYPYVTIPQMVKGRIDFSTARRISSSDFEAWTKKARPTAWDVVLSRRCNPGETVVVAPGEEFALGQNLVLLRADGSHVFPQFLRWLTRSPEWWNEIQKNLNVGAVFDSLKCADVPEFELRIPPLAEQEAIAAVLGALDDKIEQNRRTGRALERLARATFKAWFVDFEPVKAKASGAAGFPGMPLAAFAALPNRLTDSPLGPVPQGWEVKTLDDVLELQRGFDLPKSARSDGPYPVFAASGINGYHEEYRVKAPGVTTGRSGVLGRVFFCDRDFWPLNTSLWVKEYRRSNPWHAYYLLQTVGLDQLNAGSAVPTLNRNHLRGIPAVLASTQLLLGFADLCGVLFKSGAQLETESTKLAALRDYLLPRLLSGRVRVRLSHGYAKA